jgi:sterol desaturase/sphingolipid hydroxylase (fatty acid hydroxylase superfamily)
VLPEFIAQLPPIFQHLIALIMVPLRAPFDPGTLLHWPFLLSALVVAIVVYARRHQARHFFTRYFSLAVWWHPSARADYLYYLINGTFFPIVFAPLLVVSSFIAGTIAGDVVGGSDVSTTPWFAIALFSVATFIAYDFGRYVGHWIQHKVGILWEFHKVHHSAEVLTPLTSFRLHPVDLLLMSMVPGLFTGVVGGVAMLMTDGKITSWEILGMHGGIAMYHLISNLRHTHVWFSYGPVLSRYLISPAQHQIHHSAAEKHFHKNIGWAFAVWDRMFGTLYVPEDEEDIIYGLGDGTDADYHGVIRMYFLPVVRALVSCLPQARK